MLAPHACDIADLTETSHHCYNELHIYKHFTSIKFIHRMSQFYALVSGITNKSLRSINQRPTNCVSEFAFSYDTPVNSRKNIQLQRLRQLSHCSWLYITQPFILTRVTADVSRNARSIAILAMKKVNFSNILCFF